MSAASHSPSVGVPLPQAVSTGSGEMAAAQHLTVERLSQPFRSNWDNCSTLGRLLLDAFLKPRALPAVLTRTPPFDGARFDYDLSSAFQYASLINLDQLSILEACSE